MNQKENPKGKDKRAQSSSKGGPQKGDKKLNRPTVPQLSGMVNFSV